MPPRFTSPLFRAAAVVSALCVLMLAALAASPALHAGLHAHDEAAIGADHEAETPVAAWDHACAVTLFAQGAPVLLVFCLLLLVQPPATTVFFRARDEIVRAHPRYWLVPSHAPPAA
ncbi:MAG TPA: hypothetical protein VHN79_10795 [Lacunisphaera sp.]|nr:hypothetical protein [Lacunisphaera sp.]